MEACPPPQENPGSPNQVFGPPYQNPCNETLTLWQLKLKNAKNPTKKNKDKIMYIIKVLMTMLYAVSVYVHKKPSCAYPTFHKYHAKIVLNESC